MHFLNRGMDRIRRSIRRSFRKSNSSGCHQLQSLTQSSATPNDAPGIGTQSSSEGPSSGAGGAKNYCHTDEIAVRSAACSFAVKYLGACEVFESRGMSVCESALQHLRGRKRGTKALLYISGDGIRVVDQENSRGLIVDQTIEKVSFCAPDRNNDKGFSYICRDGATRRWMCHGFHATKDSGERLSHAVGCAFTVCLEKKRKRDAETAAYRNAQALAHTVELDSGIEDSCGGGAEFARTNQAYRSFRQLSMSERRSDPQKAILVDGQAQGMNTTNGATKMSNRHSMPSMSSMATVPSSTMNNASTPRPSGNPNLFERSGSLRAPILSTTAAAAAANADANVVDPQQHYQQQKQQNASSFAHFNSLQPRNEAPAKRFGTMPRMALHNEPIWEGDTEEEIGTNGELDASTNNGGWSFSRGIGNARERFYRTLPYTMPSLVPVNWCTFEQSIPTTIIEEEKQCNPRESPSPADPYHTKVEINQQQFKSTFYSSASAVRADNWLADTLQKAASLSILEKTDEQPKFLVPHSHTFGIGQRVDQQQNWHENAHKISANDTMPKMEANGGDEAKRLRVSPPRVPQSPPVVLASDMVDSGATTAHPAEDAAAIWDRLAALNGGIATGNRKPSRQIEYQLLQETEHPHSPPPMPMMENHQKLNNAVDPFDVNWSQRVLEQSAMKLKSPRPIPPRPERTKRTDNIGTVGQIERIDDQQMPFDQKSDLTKAFDQNNPFSNGKTPPVNV